MSSDDDYVYISDSGESEGHRRGLEKFAVDTEVSLNFWRIVSNVQHWYNIFIRTTKRKMWTVVGVVQNARLKFLLGTWRVPCAITCWRTSPSSTKIALAKIEKWWTLPHHPKRNSIFLIPLQMRNLVPAALLLTRVAKRIARYVNLSLPIELLMLFPPLRLHQSLH